MKKILITLFCIISSFQVYSTEYSMNEMPMYDGKHTPKVPENLRMSEGAVKLGWKYYYQGDYKTAIKRFNQAWMFNRKSIGAYYGFGLIMAQRSRKEEPIKNLKSSILYLTKASELANKKNFKILTDLGYSHTMLATMLQEKKQSSEDHFKEAEKLFKLSASINDKYPLTYALWSISKTYQKKYQDAMELLIKAEKLGYKNPPYRKDLIKNISEQKDTSNSDSAVAKPE